MEYTVDYFIEKFSAIPDELWQEGGFGDGDRHCAAGHCGARSFLDSNDELKSLCEIIGQKHSDFPDLTKITHINDNLFGLYSKYGSTPKERILNKLKVIKSCTQ